MKRNASRCLATLIVAGVVSTAAFAQERLASRITEDSAGSSGEASPLQKADSLPGSDAAQAFIAARTVKTWFPPKTPWGDPDISGVFTTKDEANTPFERPAEWVDRRMADITPTELTEAITKRQQEAVEFAPFFGGGEPQDGVAIAVPIHWFDNLAAINSRPWFVIDPPNGQVPPLTTEAETQAIPRAPLGGRRDSYIDRSLGDRCIAWGAWRLPTIYSNSHQIVQTPDHVVIRQEQVHEARIVPLDGRSPVDQNIRSYLGHARGYWEGNTLVVVTTNFHDQMRVRGFRVVGRGTRLRAGNLRLIERFTRTAPGTVEWTMTFDVPTVWTRPWTFSLPMTEDDTQIIHEYACHEGNYGLANILSAGRSAEVKAKTGQR